MAANNAAFATYRMVLFTPVLPAPPGIHVDRDQVELVETISAGSVADAIALDQ
jgi:hypothetical protein